ncbi:MAG TPA: YCF48-related protein [Chloroflexota bacterium]|nr:YCF48-related protein [Chloroflexota bacterium]
MRTSLFFPLLLALACSIAGCGSSSSAPAATPTAGVVLNHVHSIAIMPNNPNELYMGAHYHLYKSSDGGRSWVPLTNQMMLSLVLDPARPSMLFAVSLQHGFVTSTDSGSSWHPVSASFKPGEIAGVSIDPVSRAVFAFGSGIYRSSDGGAHWRRVYGGQGVKAVAVGSGGSVYAVTDTGLIVSRDGGATWKLAGAVGPAIQVAAAGAVAYAVTPFFLMKTTNGGRSWHPLNRSPTGIEFVGVAPTDPNEVLGEVSGRGFYASYDGGATWHRANAGIRYFDFNASTIRFAPSSPRVAYTAAWGLYFYATHDAGRHWTQTAVLKR